MTPQGEIKKETMICDICGGTGEDGFTPPNLNRQSFPKVCPKCKGRGELNWLERIVGVHGFWIKPGIYAFDEEISLRIHRDCDES